MASNDDDQKQVDDQVTMMVHTEGASFPAQFAAAMRKNVLQKLNTPVSCVVETVLPIFFVVCSIFIWLAVGNSDYPESHFILDEPILNLSDGIDKFVCVNRTVSHVPGLAPCSQNVMFVSPPAGVPPPLCFGKKDKLPVDDICYVVHPFAIYSTFMNFTNARPPPTLLEMVVLQWGVRATTKEERTGYLTRIASLYFTGKMWFTPDTPDTHALIAHLNNTQPLFKEVLYGGVFPDEGAAFSFISQRENEGQTWGLVKVDHLNRNQFDVSLRFNRTGSIWGSYLIKDVWSGGLGDEPSLDIFLYFSNGFLTWQYLINEYYTTQVMQMPSPPKPLIAPMGYPAYTNWDFLVVGASNGFIALFMVFSFLYPVSQITKSIVVEKELRIREAMMIMGLGSGSFYFSWFVTYALQFFIGSICCTILMKVSYLPRTDPFVIFFLHWGFGVSSITLAALMASLFSKARTAAIVAPITYFVLSIPMFITSGLSVGLRFLLLFLSPTAMANGWQLIANHEQNNGLGPKQVASERDDINMLTILFMIGIDTIIYGLLALYFDAVLPTDWGTPRHPLFCIVDPIRWCLRKDKGYEEVEDGRDKEGTFEPDSEFQNPANVECVGVHKTFERGDETFVANNHVCWKVRENEINVLLGHNGAGKTTLINLMTGMLEADDGDTMIYGNSIRNDLAACRRDIGLCPQHNILWPELTCAQHLRFFASLKGLSGDEREAAIDEFLKEVDLFEKRDLPAGSLSGGQKRKLSVAIAFIGGSRLVILDEPTAGMDVAARRHTWALIKKMAEGRTIILTTHFMDEADLLANSITIMAKGCIKCHGSPMYLKTKLGVGYIMNLSVDSSKDIDRIKNAISEVAPEAVLQATGAEELAYRLPMKLQPKFPEILAVVEQFDEANDGVRGYGISVTTLEEVFLRIAEEEAERQALQELAEKQAAEKEAAEKDATKNNNEEMQGRNETGAVAQTEEFSQQGGSTPNHPVDEHNEASAVAVPPAWTMKNSEAERSDSLVGQFVTLFIKRFHNARRDRRTQCLQVFLPAICILLAMLMTLLDFVDDSPKLYLNETLYEKAKVSPVDVITSNCNFNTTQYPHQYVPVNVANLSNSRLLSQWLVDNAKSHENHRYIAMYCDDTQRGYTRPPTGQSRSILMGNSSGNHVFGDVLHHYYQFYIHTVTAAVNGTTRIPPMAIATHSMEWTDKEAALINNIASFMIGLIIMIPFTFIPSTFVSWIVREAETKAKHLQMSSGMNFFAYWFSNLCFDTLSNCVTIILCIIIFLIFDREEYIGDGDSFGATFVLLLFYGFAGISASYLVSFAFDSHATAQNIVMLVNFICGFLLVLLIFILGFFESTKTVADVLKYFFRLVPSYCVGEGIINLAALGFQRAFGFDVNPWDMDVVGWPILYMALEFPLFFGATLLIDHPSRQKAQQALLHDPDTKPDPIPDEDPDVAAERELIENSDIQHNDDGTTTLVPRHNTGSPYKKKDVENLVVVKHLCKIYPNGKKAVRNITFGVRRGEVFGFLGTNGAGKTTSISILCGEQYPTNGRAYVCGYDVVAQSHEAQREIGYCPQFDCLLDLLTPKEHLDLYAGLRGISLAHRSEIVEELLEVCQLSDYRDAVSVSLSGGNKRKLSVAISLIGGPKVVFLDEPSAGMDPVARRGLWKVIDSISEHSGIVLTTHHLEEVEALSHRIGIMVDGKFMCLGDKTHLKNKFGTGCEMTVKIASESGKDAFVGFVNEALPGATLNEYRNLRFTYALDHATKLSEVFAALEAKKEQLGITDYAVSQTSIEQVFLRISADAELAAAEEEEKRQKAEAAKLAEQHA